MRQRCIEVNQLVQACGQFPIARPLDIISAANDIADQPAGRAGSVGYACSSFLISALPQRRQDGCTHVRQSGNWHIRIEADPKYGLPYGRQARILMLWLVRQCVVSDDTTLDVGPSFHRFLRHELGVYCTGGESGGLTTYTRQATRLFRSTFSVRRTYRGEVIHYDQMPVVEQVGGGQFDETASLQIGPAFRAQCQRHAFPIDLRAVRALRSTRSLDLYLLLAYRLPQLSHPVTLSWEDVRCHLGSSANLSTRAGLAAFRAEIAECLRAVVYLYPKALVSVGLKGLTLRHSPPPISFSGSRVLH